MSFRRALAFCACIGLAAAGSARAIDDTPTLVYGKQIGDVHIGETRQNVEYDYGSPDMHGTESAPFRSVTYTTSARKWLGITYRSGHVIHVESNSPRYRTADGVGVGARIAYGRWWHGFHLIRFSPDNYWRKRTGATTTTLVMQGNRVWLIQVENPRLMPPVP
jgi:hypothetical protein